MLDKFAFFGIDIANFFIFTNLCKTSVDIHVLYCCKRSENKILKIFVSLPNIEYNS